MDLQFGDIQETALVTLAIRASETARPNPRIVDEKAKEIIDTLGVDVSKYDPFLSHEGVVARTIMFADTLRALIRKHPDALCVNLGCGFDDKFPQVDNGQIIWFDVDLPDQIAVRRKVYEDRPRCTMLDGDALDGAWTAALPRDGERFGLELRLSSGDEVYELAGRGSQCDGDFVLRRDSESLARLSLQRSGEGLELAVVPREALLSALLPERLRSLAADLRLSLRTEGDTLRIELLEQLRTLLTLSFERSEGEETSLTAPAKALDFAQWRAALTPESFDGMFRNLKEAGLPAGLLMELRMQLEAGETASAP